MGTQVIVRYVFTLKLTKDFCRLYLLDDLCHVLFVCCRGNSPIDVTQVHFIPMFEHLADLMKVLMTLDEIIQSHTVLKEHWVLYKRYVTYSCPQGVPGFM